MKTTKSKKELTIDKFINDCYINSENNEELFTLLYNTLNDKKNSDRHILAIDIVRAYDGLSDKNKSMLNFYAEISNFMCMLDIVIDSTMNNYLSGNKQINYKHLPNYDELLSFLTKANRMRLFVLYHFSYNHNRFKTLKDKKYYGNILRII